MKPERVTQIFLPGLKGRTGGEGGCKPPQEKSPVPAMWGCCWQCRKHPVQWGHLPPSLSHHGVPFSSSYRPHWDGNTQGYGHHGSLHLSGPYPSTTDSGTLCPAPSPVL